MEFVHLIATVKADGVPAVFRVEGVCDPQKGDLVEEYGELYKVIVTAYVPTDSEVYCLIDALHNIRTPEKIYTVNWKNEEEKK